MAVDRGGRRRSGWAVLDQGISSGTNFAVGLLLARELGASSFGRYAIAVAAWMFVLGVVRTLVVQPYVIDTPSRTVATWRSDTGHVVGAALIGGLVGSVAALAGAAVLGLASPFGSVLAGLALVLPALVVQDVWRFVAFSVGDPRRATVNDACWAAAQAVVLGGLWLTDTLSAPSAVIGWGCGAACSALLGSAQFSVRPHIGPSTLAWVRHAARTGKWFTMSNLIHGAGTQGVVFVVAALAGSAAVGALRAVTNLFAPVQLLTMATESVGLPQAAYAHAVAPAAVRSTAQRYGLSLLAVAVVYAGFLVPFGPRVLPVVFGSTFEGYGSLVLPLAVVSLCGAIATGAALAIRASKLGRVLALCQATSMSVTLVAVVSLTSRYGASGAAWGLAAGALVQASLLWLALLRRTSRAAGRAERPVAAVGDEVAGVAHHV